MAYGGFCNAPKSCWLAGYLVMKWLIWVAPSVMSEFILSVWISKWLNRVHNSQWQVRNKKTPMSLLLKGVARMSWGSCRDMGINV